MTQVKEVWSKEDVKEVCAKLNIKLPEPGRDTCVRFSNADINEIISLINSGLCDPEENQNDSPTIAEFVEFMEKHSGVKAGGYVIFPPRSDVRVSIEEIEYHGEISKEFMLELVNNFRCADEFTLQDDYFRAWWD